MFKVSVIIPVYNATRFVGQAVQSVIGNVEVKQIILVEDGSTDNSLEICTALKSKYGNLILLVIHPDNANKGAVASRNLGIHSATEKVLAFLDADDYYLPHRFKKGCPILILPN